MEQSKNYLILLAIVALLVGLAIGYFYGIKIGKENGRAELLAEQQMAEEEEASQVLKDVQGAANPFSEEEQVVNPFETEYTNPFEGTSANPFAQ